MQHSKMFHARETLHLSKHCALAKHRKKPIAHCFLTIRFALCVQPIPKVGIISSVSQGFLSGSLRTSVASGVEPGQELSALNYLSGNEYQPSSLAQALLR